MACGRGTFAQTKLQFRHACRGRYYAQTPASIRTTIGLMSERGGEFQVTDAIIAGQANPGRRVIRAGRRGNDWFVWYEAGGVSYSWHAAVFRIEPGAAKPRTLANVLIPVAWASGAWTARTDICVLIDGALAGRVPPYPPGVAATPYF